MTSHFTGTRSPSKSNRLFLRQQQLQQQ